MRDEIFLDTNILIYVYTETEPEKKDITLGILEKHDIVISTQVMNEFIWVMSRKYNINLNLIKEIVEWMWNHSKVLTIGKATIQNAINISSKYRFSYWDGLIVSSAIESGCSILYTEDMQHDQSISRTLTIHNPFN